MEGAAAREAAAVAGCGGDEHAVKHASKPPPRTSGARPVFVAPPTSDSGGGYLTAPGMPSTDHRLGRLMTISSGVLRASTTTASS